MIDDPFDRLLASGVELPEGSGPPLKCAPSSVADFATIVGNVAAVTSFRGRALELRVLAAHPPNLRSGSHDDEIIASQPLASAALLSLYSDICDRHPVFSPLILGRDTSSPSAVRAVLNDVRSVVERADRTSGLWAIHVFLGFIRLSTLGDPTNAVQHVVRINDDRAEMALRVRRLLGGHASLAAAAAAGTPVKLAGVDDFLTAIAATLLAAPPADRSEIAPLRDAVDELVAQSAAHAICAETLAASRGAALLASIPAPNCEDYDKRSLLVELVRRMDGRNRDAEGPTGLGALLHRTLTPPRALALVYGPSKCHSELGFASLLWDAYAEAAERGGAAAVLAELLRAPPRGMRALPPKAVTAIRKGLEEGLTLRLFDGVPSPDTYRCRRWFDVSLDPVRLALQRVGVCPIPQELQAAVGELPNSNESHLAAIEACLVVMQEHWWILDGEHNPRHPFPKIWEYAVDLLTRGAQLAGPERFLAYWDVLFQKPEGPPALCPDGYGTINDCDCCTSCLMPSLLCPSLHRLRSELKVKLVEKGVPESDALVQVHTAKAAAGCLTGRQLASLYYSGRQPIDTQLEDALFELVDEGVLRCEGRGILTPWHFSGEPRPVRFECRDGKAVLAFADEAG
jgi:hypothetical protein